ncbi:MAG: glycosyltransferase family 1 protein [Pseudomonadota bacterium]
MHLVDTTMFYAPEGGGVQRYLTAKHHWLRKHTSVRHTILAPGGVNSCADNGIITLKSSSLLLTNGYRFPLRLAPWRKRLMKLTPDLIEVGDSFGPAWAALDAGQKMGIPVAGFYHSDVIRLVGTRFGATVEKAAARYVRHLYKNFDLVIAPSCYVAEKLQAIGVESVIRQPLGVDAELFHPKRSDPQLRRKLGLREDTRLLIFAGRFAPEKNIPVLLSAFRRLGKRYHLLLVGGGMHLNVPSNVTVYGYQRSERELARLIASCDALVHAGRQETFGLVVLEAMASALPVIGVAEGGVAELVGKRSGILVSSVSGNAFAEGIETLYNYGPELLGRRAREKVEKSYSWNQVMRSLLALYQERLLFSWGANISNDAYAYR